MINDPLAAQTASAAPRLRVKANGVVMPGALKASVTLNNYYQCDHFSASFVMSSGQAFQGNAGSRWWDVPPPLMIEIEFSPDGTAWAAPFIGEVDHLSTNFLTDVIEMDGRDISARFIEAKTQETFANQTSSQVAATLAARRGMAANITPTTGLVGRFYEQDHTRISLGQFGKAMTEWDLLVFLAQREGFDVYMTGATLNFVPYVNPASDPFVLNWTPFKPLPRLNAVSLHAERSLTIAKDIKVTVQSWNSRQKRSFTKTSIATGGKQGQSTGATHGKATAVQEQRIVRANLTEDEAQKLANQVAHELTLHERTVSLDLPGETTLTPRNMVLLQGTGTSFDQTYYVSSIERSLSFEDGLRTSLRLKNSSPRTVAQA